MSIGEAIDGPEKMISNPFLSEALGGGQAGQQWEVHRQQMMAQMALMREQLKQETAARIESQARVEHLLLQNKQLLTHVQKLMVQLEKLQSLQMAQLLASGVQPPPTTTTTSSSPPVDISPTASSPVMPNASPEAPPTVPISSSVAEPPAQTTPPPPPEAPPTEPPESSYKEVAALPVTVDLSSMETTEIEPLPTPFDVPMTTPLLPPDEEESPPRTSTPVAPPPDPEEPVVPQEEEEDTQESPSPFPDTTNLATNDPFTPQ
jgi:hypothetical protein